MIRPLKHADTLVRSFITADIENYVAEDDDDPRNGEVVWVSVYDGYKYYDWPNWYEAFPAIVNRAANDEKWRTIYAHNGGGWDWLSLIQYICTIPQVFQPECYIIRNGTKVICVTMTFKGGLRIALCDSLHLFHAGLEDVAKKFLGKGKVDRGDKKPHELLESNRPLFLEYVHADVRLLYDSLDSFCTLLHTHIAPLPKIGITLASTAMLCFRSMLEENIAIPTDKAVKDFLRQGYTGGRVEVFKSGYYEKVYCYDVNSLYPFIMSTHTVPANHMGFWTEHYLGNDVNGVYEIRYSQPRNDGIPPVLLNRGVGSYEGTGTYYTPELERLLEVGGSFTVLRGYAFAYSAKIFGPYVARLFALRMQDKDSPLGEICKLLMNSLYGKLGQNPVREKVIRCNSLERMKEIADDKGPFEVVDPAMGLYSITETTICTFEHVGIAGTITSAARAHLHRLFNAGLVYCDTDSVHTTIPITTGIGSELGMLKKEFEGEGVYAGKKLYALRDKEETKIRVKGVRVRNKSKKKKPDNLGSNVAFDDIRALIFGETRLCSYKSATTPGEVFRGKQPCRFWKRKRTIRRTA